MHWGCDDAAAVDIEVNPQRRRFNRRQSDCAVQVLIECRAEKTEHVRVVLRWHSCEVCLGLQGESVEKEDAKICHACVELLTIAGRKEVF